MNTIKITPSMVTLWHVAATITGGVLLPILLGLVQYVSAHGANVGQDISYGIPVLIGGLATLPVSIWHAIQASPALPQAEKDVEAQAQAVGGHVASQLSTWLESRFQALENTFAVHQHSAPVAPASVPQLAFSPSSVVPLTMSTAGTSVPPAATLPPRSFSDSALMPAVNLNTPVQPVKGV